MSSERKTMVISGPTSTGKTSLAINLSQEFNGEIISADSRQIFQYMDIGTGKLPVGKEIPFKKEADKWILDGINVWGYDLIEPGKYYSAYDFALFALEKIREIEQRGKNCFLVGGTGFYIDAVTGKVELSAKIPDFALRKELEKMTLEDLQRDLTSLNPEVYKKIDQDNKVRLVRAIEKERSENAGTPLPLFEPGKFVQIGLTAERNLLFENADKWLETIWNMGLLEEVRDLISRGFSDTPQLHGLVYKSVLAFFNKELSEEKAKERSMFDLHSYIRRQLTWFKRNENIKWFDITMENFSQTLFNHVKSKVYG